MKLYLIFSVVLAWSVIFSSAFAQTTSEPRLFENQAINFPNTADRNDPNIIDGVYDLSLWRWIYTSSANPSPDFPNTCLIGSDMVERYPFRVRFREIGGNDLVFRLPYIFGSIDEEAPWGAIYAVSGVDVSNPTANQATCNSASIFLGASNTARFSVANTTIDGARIVRVLDAIRPADTADNFTIKNTWITTSRDDCVENDRNFNGTISDSLFDGCYFGISMQNNSIDAPSSNILTVDRLLLRLPTFNISNRDGSGLRSESGDFFKVNSTSAKTILTNNVFAYDTEHIGPGGGDFIRMIARRGPINVGNNVVDGGLGRILDENNQEVCSNNKLLWMANDSPPDLIREHAPCFELLTGQAARDHWNEKKCAWINDHPPVVATDPVALQPGAVRRQLANATLGTAADPTSCVAPTVDITTFPAADVETGTPVIFAATAANDENIDVANGLEWTSSLDGDLGSGASISIASLSVGTHEITASYVNTISVSYADTIIVTVSPQPIEVEITAKADSPIVEGALVAFDGRLLGADSAEYEFLWRLRGDATDNAWLVLRDFDSLPAFEWNSTGFAGRNIIQFRARRIGTNGPDVRTRTRVWVDEIDPAISVSLSADAASPVSVGEVVMLTGIAENAGGGSFEYQFTLQPGNGAEPVILQEFNVSNQITFDTSNFLGRNRIVVRARKAGTNDFPVKDRRIIWVNDIDPVVAGSLVADVQSPQPSGSLINFVAEAVGGAGTPEFAFQVRDITNGGKWETFRDFEPNNTASWLAPSTVGEFRFRSLIRNAGSLDRPVRTAIFHH